MICIIAIMKTSTTIDSIERKIDAVRQALLKLGPMHPGSMTQQYQVCGRPGCRCVDPEHPQRHGPYEKLAYVHRGKQVCRFVRAGTVDELRKQTEEYKTFRKLMDEWIELSILQGQSRFFSKPAPVKAQKGKKGNPKPTKD